MATLPAKNKSAAPIQTGTADETKTIWERLSTIVAVVIVDLQLVMPFCNHAKDSAPPNFPDVTRKG